MFQIESRRQMHPRHIFLTRLSGVLIVAVLTSLTMLVPVASAEEHHGNDHGFTPVGGLEVDPHDHDDPGLSEPEGASGVIAPYFNESEGCGPPAGVATPLTTTDSSSNRSIPSGHQVRGPWGDFFGRDYGDVNGSMVWWTVPMSGGKQIKVHERALPAFERVAQNLAAEEAAGRRYTARMVSGFVWRRISGSYRMSTHAFGTTIDINWDTNPYRGDNVLVTDMPDWYVQAWKDAGFCWGGDWQNVKDAMHFAWKGPRDLDGHGDLPAPYPPKTAASGYADRLFRRSTVLGPAPEGAWTSFADGNRDGAPDLIRVRPYGSDGVLLELARSSRNFGRCGVSRFRADDLQGQGSVYLAADYDGDSRLDVWAIDESGSHLAVAISTRDDDYDTVVRHETGAFTPPVGNGDYAVADYDRDGMPDLYVIDRARGGSVVVEVWSGADGFQTRLVRATTAITDAVDAAANQFAIADFDVDGIPDLAVIRVTSVVRFVWVAGSGGYAGGATNVATGAVADVAGTYAFGDYDGDGRPDLLHTDAQGRVSVYLGGDQLGSASFWFQPADWRCAALFSPSYPWDYDGDQYADLTVGVPGEDLEVIDAGMVHVVSGATEVDRRWMQGGSVPSPQEAGDGFGETVASGDFDDDGYADLVVGVPGDDIGPIVDGGLINVIYGSSDGLDAGGPAAQMWHQDASGIKGTAEAGDRFGDTLAAGDFDGDGYQDLAIGIPGEDVSGRADAGAVQILFGGDSGLGARDQIFHQDTSGIKGAAEAGDQFGASLAAADFDRDGFTDLAIGVPGEDLGAASNAGMVAVIFGGPDGLTPVGDEVWHQDVAGVPGVNESGDRFGAVLAVGDFDGDGHPDLAVAAVDESIGSIAEAGGVVVLRGDDSGITAAGAVSLHQGRRDVRGGAEAGDHFGSTLIGGDFDDDGFDDLVVGVPHEDIGTTVDAGGVAVFYGTATGPGVERDDFWTQSSPGVAATVEAGDRFGSSLQVGDFDGDVVMDLAIGARGEDLGSLVDAGVVHVIPGRRSVGLDAAGSRLLYQGGGLGGSPEAGDGFGVLVGQRL